MGGLVRCALLWEGLHACTLLWKGLGELDALLWQRPNTLHLAQGGL